MSPISTNLEYDLMVAFIRFRDAYGKLVAASTRLPNYNLGEAYPFYILDFEEIEPAVNQWCNIQISKLMKQLPERVENPACLKCRFLGKGLLKNNTCFGLEATDCGLYPYVLYDKNIVTPALQQHGISTDTSDEWLHLNYLQLVRKLIAEINKKEEPYG